MAISKLNLDWAVDLNAALPGLETATVNAINSLGTSPTPADLTLVQQQVNKLSLITSLITSLQKEISDMLKGITAKF